MPQPALNQDFWPDDNAFMPMQARYQIAQPGVICRRLAVCDERGAVSLRFMQGGWVNLFFEFEIARDLRAPIGGAEFRTDTGLVVHGKNTYHSTAVVPERVAAGTLLRIRQSFMLHLASGEYAINLGLCDAESDWLATYLGGHLSYEQFLSGVTEYCRVIDAAFISIVPPPGGMLLHHGPANLPATARVTVAENAAAAGQPGDSSSDRELAPPLLHVTHWKAGSQWIYGILKDCVPGEFIEPQLDEIQVRRSIVRPGCVYPTVYMSRPELDRIALPPGARIFVVIRDLRDTLVSAYFSFKVSHPVLSTASVAIRDTLELLDKEVGLFYLLEHFLPRCAEIQLTWLEAAMPVLRYEDLVQNDFELLSDVLIGRLKAPISPERLRAAVEANRFEVLSKGRARGSEDVTAHTRKGVAGDWRNHFTEKLKKAFKARYGGLLVEAGYERDLAW